MRLFLIPDTYKGGDSLVLVESDYHYLIRVLRYKAGYEFPGRDSKGNVFDLKITDISDDRCILEVKKSVTDYFRLPEIVLYQCVCKGKKMDQIIRQATEAGVSKIIPVVSDFLVSKFDTGKSSKIERWNKIIREAIQQSGSRVNTLIGNSVTIDELGEIDDSVGDIGLFFHQEALDSGSLHRYLGSGSGKVLLVVGPEGGLSDRETDILFEKKFSSVYLKTNILRAETAAVYVIGAVQTILLESANWILK
ncbi:MAG: 16S rRNA (uracil(1498)-N(3))-methyltransferase [Spirochaetota bacterium]|nr:16S rRNA (uracil(1498)-N(3))-methyltransferase [Spirochaetota bacterium]